MAFSSIAELLQTPAGRRNAAKIQAAGVTPAAQFMPDAFSGPVPDSDRPENWHHGRLMEWLRGEGLTRFPELADSDGHLLIFHIPNERKASRQTLAILQGMGVRAGVSDFFLPLARGGYFGLWLELKAIGGKASGEQKTWLASMRANGYAAHVADGWQAAVAVLVNYLTNPKPA